MLSGVADQFSVLLVASETFWQVLATRAAI